MTQQAVYVATEPVLIMEGDRVIGRIEAERYAMPEITKADFAKSESFEGGNFPRADPIITRAPDGTVYVAYQHPGVVLLHKSADGGRTWQRVNVARRPSHSDYGCVHAFGATDDGALVLLHSGHPSAPPDVASLPPPEAEKRWLEWVMIGQAHFARSEDGGVTWTHLHQADTGDFQVLHGMGKMLLLPDGCIMASPNHSRHRHDPNKPPQDHIWRSVDGGRSFQQSGALPPHSIESNLLQTRSGRLLAALRTCYLGQTQDHPRGKRTAITHSGDGGQTWTEPYLVTSAFGDCPGELVGLPDGRVLLLYCHRYAPMKGVYGRLSEDEGETFNSRQYAVRLVGDENPGIYSSSVLLADGAILTITAQHEGSSLQAIRWSV